MAKTSIHRCLKCLDRWKIASISVNQWFINKIRFISFWNWLHWYENLDATWPLNEAKMKEVEIVLRIPLNIRLHLDLLLDFFPFPVKCSISFLFFFVDWGKNIQFPISGSYIPSAGMNVNCGTISFSSNTNETVCFDIRENQ